MGLKKSLKQIPLGFEICNKNVITLPILVDKNLNLNYEINGLDLATKNCKKTFKLADTSYYNSSSNTYEIDFLLDLDLLQFFSYAISILLAP